ncbi:MAG: hypothetical protein ACRC8W_03710 [Plesiomonas shigelloides]
MQKGQMVKRVESYSPLSLTTGKLYPVHAVAGDEDHVCGGKVGWDCFITTSDNGNDIYCTMYDEEKVWGRFELVQE